VDVQVVFVPYMGVRLGDLWGPHYGQNSYSDNNIDTVRADRDLRNLEKRAATMYSEVDGDASANGVGRCDYRTVHSNTEMVAEPGSGQSLEVHSKRRRHCSS
jgi:hypothetical protein